MKKNTLKTESINEYLNRGGTISRLKSKPTVNEVHPVGSTKSRLFLPKCQDDFKDGQSPNLKWVEPTYIRDSQHKRLKAEREMAVRSGFKRFYEKD